LLAAPLLTGYPISGLQRGQKVPRSQHWVM
jgi:hypothetical protein